MTDPVVMRELLGLPDSASRKALLRRRASDLNDSVAEALKSEADQLLRADLDQCRQMCELLSLTGELTGDPRHRALALLAQANLHLIGQGHADQALDLYNEAAEVYDQCGEIARQARSQIGKIAALTRLGRYDEALVTAQWAAPVLEEHRLWGPLADLYLNSGYIYGHKGDDRESLVYFTKAREIHEQHGAQDSPSIPLVDNSSSIALCNLGRFDEAIVTCQRAHDAFMRLGQPIEAARARQELGVIHFLLGRYNEALQELSHVRRAFATDGRNRDAVLADLLICDCLLQLRRFDDVLARSDEIRATFSELGTPLELAQALLDQAVACAGLARYVEAQEILMQARRTAAHAQSDVWVGIIDLEHAAVLRLQNEPEHTLELARSCAHTFADHGLLVKRAQAQLLSAWALSALDRVDMAKALASEALHFAETRDLPALTYQVCHLLGQMAARQGDTERATTWLDRTLDELERVRGRIMIEYRAAFVEDKQLPYQDAIETALIARNPDRALLYAERSKSRSLVDLLANRLDIGIHLRDEVDREPVAQLLALRERRDRLYRLWEGRDQLLDEGLSADDRPRQLALSEMLQVETQITALWHTMLVRNADYAEDASLWQVQVEPAQPYLSHDTVLIEYCLVHDQFVTFVVEPDRVQAWRLDAPPAQVERLLQLLWLNLGTVPTSDGRQVEALHQNALLLLGQLYRLLIAPWEKLLENRRGVIFVPHGMLHYMPFQALYDGARYLLQRLEVSYLPSASLLRHSQRKQAPGTEALVYGHSHGGSVPHAIQEARRVAELLDVQPCVEHEATLATLQDRASDCGLIHLAAHGEFRSDNPLFSGLALDDGWLTTLDVFGLDLKASLVTISACETARSKIGGGDELLGLMRAFLHAGASSLLMSLWTVDDRSTSELMARFYESLVGGATSARALAEAQQAIIASDAGGSAAGEWGHPYYWAPFVLVGGASING